MGDVAIVRTIGVLTTGRADYGICLPVLKAIAASPELDLKPMVTGMHLSPEFGLSVKEIEKDGIEVAERVEILLSSDTPEGVTKSMGLAMIGFAQAFSRSKPDILLVVGDRFEVQAAVAAAVPFEIPVAHVHGGEITEGAIDELFRHAITKMSHIHFATTDEHARRIAQMGEEEWRICVSGAPGLDNMLNLQALNREELADRFEVDFDPRGHLLFVMNDDQPGVIGMVGRILGEHGINIARMECARVDQGVVALLILGLDIQLPDDVLDTIKSDANIQSAKWLKL